MNSELSKIQTLLTPELLKIPLVEQLLDLIEKQAKKIEQLDAEIKRLKGHPQKPEIKASRIENGKKNTSVKNKDKRAGSEKRSKTKDLEISRDEIIKVVGVKDDWEFKGYKDYIVQDIIIKSQNVRYRLEKYLDSEGKYVSAHLPENVQGHYGSDLRKFIIYQYYNCHVTQPLLLEQLREIGIDISSGTLNNILIQGHDIFHNEKEDLLSKGLEVSSYIQSDDTGARHNGKNGYCTVICNEFFTYFKSGASKSRINFLNLLRTPKFEDYYINEYSLAYFKQQNMPIKYQILFESQSPCSFSNEALWNKYLENLGISAKHAITIATQGALLGSIIEHGISKELAIISDDAGQFNILEHALCWVHAERNIQKVHCYTKEQENWLEDKLNDFWQLYQNLKDYKIAPDECKKEALSNQFDNVFNTSNSCFFGLNKALEKITKNKTELLLVLERPEIPLHNNTSERDIREYVKTRKISGSTRSELGQKCRDTFISLKKTCLKLGLKYWKYLDDRIKKKEQIPKLAQLIVAKSTTTY